MNDYIRLARPRHYIKNLLIFLPLACSGLISSPEKLIKAALAFLAFCMASSGIYAANDIKDRKKDALHPVKKSRPVASGKIEIHKACLFALILLIISIVVIMLAGPKPAACAAAYIVINLAYASRLKHVPIIDILALSSGFLLRLLCGAEAADIKISGWLYLTVLSYALYFAIGKRRGEFISSDSETRPVLNSYSLDFLDRHMNICLTMGHAFYALWAMEKNNIAMLTVPLVIAIAMLYDLNISKADASGDPVSELLGDKKLLALCAIYIILMAAAIYGKA